MAVLGEALMAYEADPVNDRLDRLLSAVRDVLRWDVQAATLRVAKAAAMDEEALRVVEFVSRGWWVIKVREGRGFTRIAGPFLTRGEARRDADSRV